MENAVSKSDSNIREAYLTKHFRKSEMRCRCRREDCDAVPMKIPFLNKLEALRVAWDREISPTSAARCSMWNQKVGGAPDSQHLVGNAADFFFSEPTDAIKFAILAAKCGFGGIGTGRHLVHVDDRGFDARWQYKDK